MTDTKAPKAAKAGATKTVGNPVALQSDAQATAFGGRDWQHAIIESLDDDSPVNIALPILQRPLTGQDVVRFGEEHNLTRMDVVAKLAMTSPSAYNDAARAPARSLSFERELLLRRELSLVSRAPKREARDVFQSLYGPLLREFGLHTPEGQQAKVMLYERFAALFGNSVFSAYRWMRVDLHGEYGRASLPLQRLFATLPDDPVEQRQILEGLAKEAYGARGLSFDAIFPLPDPRNPPAVRPKGMAGRMARLSAKKNAR